MFFKQLTAPEDTPSWGLLLALGIMIFAFVFKALVGGALGSLFFPNALNTALLFGWCIGGILTILLIGRLTRQAYAELRLTDEAFPALIAFGIGFGAAITFDLIAIPFTNSVAEPPELVRVAGGLALALGVIFMVLIQPISEELVFRGILYPALRAAQNFWLTLVFTAILYGLFHQLLYTYPSDVPAARWYTLVEPILAGLVLTGLRAYSRSTRAAIAAHAGIGVFGVLKTLLIATLFTS